MNAEINAQIQNKFKRMGARAAFRETRGSFRIDIRRDRRGEFFQLDVPDNDLRLQVLDVQRQDRHLLLMVDDGLDKQKFLCGHDERHWFVAAVPEKAPVSNVATAKEALKPEAVREAEARTRLKKRARSRRRNQAWVRQGEWFFIPVPRLQVAESLVLRHEPLVRGSGSKPHWAEFCYRTGGESVYVCRAFPNGLTENAYRDWLQRHPESKMRWTQMRRNPGVYVRGRISHADHATIQLNCWHRVVMNTENQAQAMRNVAFLD